MLGNSNKTEQSNIAANNVTGRDDNSTTNNYYQPPLSTSNHDLVLRRLLEEHEKAKQKDADYQKFSDELNNFFKQQTEKNHRDLTQKLLDGNRENLVNVALAAKAKVTMKINKHSFSKSAQEVYTYLLTNIRITFKHTIEARIKSGKFENFDINDLVDEKIIEPFFQEVQGSRLYIDRNELYGLLYLLTGNCHIEWD
ncbi:MAG: hypothetical protein GQ532_08560 [Methylomarinum sp.]|nr:hypothetical protein [Methylomarinum sp.]